MGSGVQGQGSSTRNVKHFWMGFATGSGKMAQPILRCAQQAKSHVLSNKKGSLFRLPFLISGIGRMDCGGENGPVGLGV
jgi:hypothetical protein